MHFGGLGDFQFHLPHLVSQAKSGPAPKSVKVLICYMLYRENRNRYRHVLGTKISAMPTFILTFKTFMGLKIYAFRVIKEKPHLWADILDFGGRPL